ncbi:hypothetical protein ACIP98_23535 [Streptomyces sp. NPDC088354]|uniref:hypothetical protein n=1 Tax=unclassified Streptomyces TaxID=2593676 RepID=UPI0029BDFE82|nr:hypothetical protein [Streptomyces sp. MI02-7b]MDX3072965.1 hypothetical protein [Streptomyces sp. MI02-7b]
MEERRALEQRIRGWLVVFVVCLVLSGVTAFPLVHEVRWVDGWGLPGFVGDWISHVREGADATDAQYPFLFYGTDWLAFAHLVIAVAFYGVWRDAVRNIWIVEWAMIACAGVIPLAAICIPIRGLPLWWMPVDMAFGVFGVVPLLILRRMIKRLEAMPAATAAPAEPVSGAGAAA